MIDLARFWNNPFNDERISTEELIRFTADFLAKLNAMNGTGLYNDLIASVLAAFTALGGKVQDEATAKALRSASTLAVELKREELLAKISQIEGLAHGSFKRGTPTYLTLFPAGLEEFRSAQLDLLEGKVDSLATRLGTVSVAIGAANVAALETLRSQWENMRGEQVSKKAAAGTGGDLRRVASAALRDELFKAWLTLGVRDENRDQPDRAALFARQSLLEDPEAEEAPTPVPAGV